MKLQLSISGPIIALIGLLPLTACDSATPPPAASSAEQSKKPTTALQSSAGAQSSGQTAGKPQSKQSAKPGVNLPRTKRLYDSTSTKKPGSTHGAIEWRDGTGILIHPGSTPTEVVFDVSAMSGSTDLAFWISGLPQNALGNPKSGTAAVEVFLDGISQGRKKVDRQTNESLTVNLTGVSTMRVVVDDADGVQFFDWFFMGVK